VYILGSPIASIGSTTVNAVMAYYPYQHGPDYGFATGRTGLTSAAHIKPVVFQHKEEAERARLEYISRRNDPLLHSILIWDVDDYLEGAAMAVLKNKGFLFPFAKELGMMGNYVHNC